MRFDLKRYLQHSIFIRAWREQSAQYRLTYYNVLVLISNCTSCLCCLHQYVFLWIPAAKSSIFVVYIW